MRSFPLRPRLFLACILALCFGSANGLDFSITRYEAHIQAFEEADRLEPPPANATVVTGSSTIRLWSTMQTDLAPLPTIRRGFGGSTILELDYYLDRIVLKYRPSAVVIYEGENDIAEGSTPQQVTDTFSKVIGRVHNEFPAARIFVISIKPSPSRWSLWDKAMETNKLLADLCSTDPRLRYIDASTVLLGSDGRPRADYFADDQLHLNAAGYKAWSSAIKPALLVSTAGLTKVTPQPPMALCIDDAGCAKTVTPPTTGIKWHPGHYMDSDSIERPGSDPKNLSMSALTSIAGTPFRGVLVRYGWTTLEPEKNQYDFSRIRAHRDALAKIGKYLIVQIQDRSFDGDGPPPSYVIPPYLRTDPEFGGGWAPRGESWGTAPKLWLASVMDRQIALQAALAAEFDKDPFIEIVSFEETALFNIPPDGYSKAAMAAQYRRLADAMSASWSNTNVCILTNFFHNIADLTSLIDYFQSKRICVGGPDVRPDNRTDGSEIISGQIDGINRSTRTAILFHNEYRSLDGTWTLEQLQDYAHNTNGQHYTTWIRRESATGLKYSTDVRPWVISTNPPTRTTCPSAYSKCLTN
jgi:lysophospholipase L1-like esterase